MIFLALIAFVLGVLILGDWLMPVTSTNNTLQGLQTIAGDPELIGRVLIAIPATTLICLIGAAVSAAAGMLRRKTEKDNFIERQRHGK